MSDCGERRAVSELLCPACHGTGQTKGCGDPRCSSPCTTEGVVVCHSPCETCGGRSEP